VPCQQLPEPGSAVIFTFDRHQKPIRCSAIGGKNDSYVFTLSDKLNFLNINEVCNRTDNDIHIEKIPDEFNFLILFMNKHNKIQKKIA